MRHTIISTPVALVFIFLTLILLSGSTFFKKQSTVGSLGVPLIGQGMNEWCWAACTEMVTLYYKNKGKSQHVIKQCELVRTYLDMTYASRLGSRLDSLRCDGHSAIDSDDVQGTPFLNCDSIYSTASSFGQMSYKDLAFEIAAGRPVIFSWGFFGLTYGAHDNLDAIEGTDVLKGLHWLVAEGCPSSVHSDSLWVSVNDPLPVGEGRHQVMAYSAFAGCIPSPDQPNRNHMYNHKYVFYNLYSTIYQIQPKHQ